MIFLLLRRGWSHDHQSLSGSFYFRVKIILADEIKRRILSSYLPYFFHGSRILVFSPTRPFSQYCTHLSMPSIHWIPLTRDFEYNQRTVALAPEYGVNTIHFSHDICHNADDLICNPTQAAHVRRLADLYRDAGLALWCWTHEVRNPPEALVSGDKLLADDQRLTVHLEEKYERFFTETLPGLDGLVLTFAETQFPVYQNDRIISKRDRMERTEQLIGCMRDICHRHGKRIAIRDFVYRVDEVEAFREVIARLPADIIVMSKCVPHDWQPFYPHNPLIGDVGGHEQWIEHDFGLEYEGQHLYPFGNLDTVFDRFRHGARNGANTLCLRLDRFAGDRKQSAIDTPWGRTLLQAATDFSQSECATVEGFRNRHPAPPWELLETATRSVCAFLFPLRFWLANHSNLPSYEYARNHLVGGNADRLPQWSGAEEDIALEKRFISPDTELVERLQTEADDAVDLACDACEQAQALPSSSDAEAWRSGTRQLLLWARLFREYRDVFFSLRLQESQVGGKLDEPLSAKIDRLRNHCQDASVLLADTRLESVPPMKGRSQYHPSWDQLCDLLQKLSRKPVAPSHPQGFIK
jgi:hypothetical protein